MNKLKNFICDQWVEGTGKGEILYNAVTDEPVAIADTAGIDFKQALHYGRTTGFANLQKYTFHERGAMLKKLALHLLSQKEKMYQLSYATGATKADSWVDIEGGIGVLFSYASIGRRELSNTKFWVQGATQKLSKNGTQIGTHINVPIEGCAVQINAYNFPCWGMLEKLGTSLLAGVPAIVKPGTPTAYLTELMFREMIAANVLPEGALQLVCGEAGDLLAYLQDGDSVVFTGSAATGKKLKAMPSVINNTVRFNMEADSLNASILGLDANPNTPEFDLFIKEVTREISAKAGQKCTAIRRVIVPEKYAAEVMQALIKSVQKTKIGNPLNKEVRMGALAGKKQCVQLLEKVEQLQAENELFYDDEASYIDVEKNKGAFISHKLFYCDKPLTKTLAHDIEPFGPVATVMPYKTVDESIEILKLGKGSLVGSIISYDNQQISETALRMANMHGRIFILNRDNAKESTGHGSPLPQLKHGGPGRAGNGEEMGGLDGLNFYMHKVAVQGPPDALTAITQQYQQGATKKMDSIHPFSKYFEEIQVGDSLETAGRTVTDADIINFSNVSWDHFYAHTDITSLSGTIFKHRVAHGYFILSAAAGLFVYGKKGPVIANYGIDECRFLQPVYAGDTIFTYLTCQEKIDKESKGKNVPSGVVKWCVEVYNQRNELVALATILTLVAKKSPFIEIDIATIKKCLYRLSEKNTAQWGIMKAQNMVEHLEDGIYDSLGKNKVEVITPAEKLEAYQETLYNHKLIPRNYKHPLLPQEENMPLRHKSLDDAKQALLLAIEEFLIYYKATPDAVHSNAVYGQLDKEMWELLHRKHFTHHFTQFNLL